MQHQLTSKEVDLVEQYTQEIPVKVGSLAKDLGLEVKLATLSPGISGEIRPDAASKSGYKIRINRHESKERQRFTLAHEIAHYLLHRNLIGDGLQDSVLYRSRLSNKVEAQANGLAANLLMPKLKVSEYLEDRKNLDDESMVEILANAFEVSKAAMRIRLGVE